MKKDNHIEKMLLKIFSQADQGKVVIESEMESPWFFYVKFHNNLNLKIEDDAPVVTIQNKERFITLIKNYLEVAKDFYEEDKEYFELSELGFEEKLITDLFVNATNFDLHNIEHYIEERIKMLTDEITYCDESIIGDFLDCRIVAKITKNKSNLETPYKFSAYFEKDKEKFILPKVYFGRIENKLKIFALQGEREKQDNKLSKKLDRYFRKVNKDVDMEDEILSKVSPNGLVAMTIFMAYQKMEGAKQVEAVNFMPIRYDSNCSVGIQRAKNEEEKEEFLQDLERNQFNISNKFLNTLIRYAFHFDLQYEYDEVFEKLVIDLKNTTSGVDNILFDIDKAVCDCLKEFDYEV